MIVPARGRAALFLVLALTAVPATAQTPAGPKAPVTHEALWMMKRVGAPAVSPDGRWVVVSVTEPSYDEKKEAADLWIVPADASAPPRRLTSSKGGESGADWSPDSRRLAFTARREDDEVAQVYVIDVAGGGEARRLTSSPLATRAPRWSPDGRSILYQSAVYPGAADVEANRKIAAARKDAKSKVRIYDTFPIRRWDKWLDDTQSRLFVIAADGEGQARDLLAGTQLVRSRGSAARAARDRARTSRRRGPRTARPSCSWPRPTAPAPPFRRWARTCSRYPPPAVSRGRSPPATPATRRRASLPTAARSASGRTRAGESSTPWTAWRARRGRGAAPSRP